MNSKTTTIAVIGLGYVGLPLAVEFGKHINTIGFDIEGSRIKQLVEGYDKTMEVDGDELKAATKLRYTSNTDDLAEANVYIVTVPTPIDRHKNPDLRPLRKASEMVGCYLSADDIVIYESTVYPGATEEVCVPILAAQSGLEFNRDFFVGYSPERINPGDKEHGVTSIQKVTSGSTPATADFVDDLYKTIITAGTYQASSVKVAEAAKVIENTQRDVNIALVNELAMIFDRMDIDTEEVLKAAGTKWNFLPFRPGLVGGHCIGVDPYYLTHKATELGYHPEMILAGRRINDDMGSYVVDQVTRIMTQNRIHIVDSNILLLGLTFKENCPDFRNTRVIDIVEKFTDQHANVDVYDPWVDADEVYEEYGFRPLAEPDAGAYDAIIMVVAHQQFIDMGADAIRKFGKADHVLFDVKYMFPAEKTDGRL
ncbi:MAG: Vi polysaccharide biosynthesis UDP-N-acetylglucosamine C-6 dehydrogenase TviB [Gammaproteobacteria bacterium]|nr:Vi polysaccharide biosynthesis UDP-N-acetylglucosamine C-6 dehydrogenase TviB [Gammaproteobacteria bacterium]